MGLFDQIRRLSDLTLSRAVEQQEHDAAPQKHQEKLSEDGRLGTEQPLLSPYKAGVLDLDIRMVYAPLTRCRAIGEPQFHVLFSMIILIRLMVSVVHHASRSRKLYRAAPACTIDVIVFTAFPERTETCLKEAQKHA